MNIYNVKITASENVTLGFKSKNQRIPEEYLKEINFKINVPEQYPDPINKAMRMALDLGLRVYVGEIVKDQPAIKETNLPRLAKEKLKTIDKEQRPVIIEVIPNLNIVIDKE